MIMQNNKQAVNIFLLVNFITYTTLESFLVSQLSVVPVSLPVALSALLHHNFL